MRDLQNVMEVCSAEPDYLGYIFYSKSVRYVGKSPDPRIFSTVPSGIQKVAVFVNEYYERMVEITGRFGINVLQLHGMESPELCQALRIHGKTIIKVIPADQLANEKLVKSYVGAVDYFLFDTPVLSFGGSGRKFNWTLLSELKSDVNFFLSGGLSAEDADQLKAIDNPLLYAVDVNSRFEKEPGIKDVELVKKFIKDIRDEKE